MLQLILTETSFVKSPPSGVIVGILALMTMGESMLVTSLAESEGEVARHFTTEPVLVTEMVDVRSVGEVIEGVSGVGSLPSKVQRISAPNVAEKALMTASEVKVPPTGSSTGADALTTNGALSTTLLASRLECMAIALITTSVTPIVIGPL